MPESRDTTVKFLSCSHSIWERQKLNELIELVVIGVMSPADTGGGGKDGWSRENSTCESSEVGGLVTRGHQKRSGGFPGGVVVESLPAGAGDAGSSPGLGRSHMPGSNRAREPQLLSLRVWSLCSATGEATIVRGPRTAMKSDPRLPQLEKALAQK